jgi:hypothetical protein
MGISPAVAIDNAYYNCHRMQAHRQPTNINTCMCRSHPHLLNGGHAQLVAEMVSYFEFAGKKTLPRQPLPIRQLR